MARGVWLIEGVTEALAELAAEGFSASQIAERLNARFGLELSKNSVIGRVHRTEGLNRTNKSCRPEQMSTRPKMPRFRAPKRHFAVAVSPDEPQPLGIDTGCQWPHGEPVDRNFCGHPKLKGSAYCPHHFARCYRGLVNHPAQVTGKAA